eukprot:NODE_711_length_1963_cov_29.317659_g658_i0.p1 GENE.NODE_711_length_1963_cov_29.317659_g658_i0~~NODE_711_length_1963_cov_29.317659_g658_i0.p1  ORF type:complete len:350 (+),score=18.38 NODE_711_length_1963_cov_29.317659_g658_i0:675-1724(+)
MPTTNTWGGSLVESPVDGSFHLFASRFARDGSVLDWFVSSEIVHALSVSGNPKGPFRVVSIALGGSGNRSRFDATTTHNPHVQRHPRLAGQMDELYVMYYIGLNCMVLRGRDCEQRQAIGLAHASSLDGPWVRGPAAILEPHRKYNGGREVVQRGVRTWAVVANPAVVISPRDGSVLLFYRGVLDDGVFLATAQSWRGPYVRVPSAQGDSPSIVGALSFQMEDMFVWQTPFGCNMLAHARGARTSVLFHSSRCNATRPAMWHRALDPPYSKCVALHSPHPGQVEQRCFHRRERPQLLLQNGIPRVLCTAVEEVSAAQEALRNLRRVQHLPIPKKGIGRSQHTLCTDIIS